MPFYEELHKRRYTYVYVITKELAYNVLEL